MAALLEAVSTLEKETSAERESVVKYKELVAEADKHLAKATGKASSRRAARSAIQTQLKSLRGSLTAVQDASVGDALSRVDACMTEVASIAPSTGSVFVRLFLGQVNVLAVSPKDRATLRDEYNKFKDRTNIGFLVLPLLWLVTSFYLRYQFRYTDWIYKLTHVWLLYYYVSLSLRENILRVNGSHIRMWWIYHHYISSLMSVIVLTWPADSASWARFLPQFTLYFLYQGVVQFMQARYQKARHYALTAMGKATHMDVSNTETLTEFHAGLYAILALVIVAQAWQVYNGYSLFLLLFQDLNVTQPWYDFREEVQCTLLAVMFVFLGVMNCYQTIATLIDKSSRARKRAELRRRASEGSNSAVFNAATTQQVRAAAAQESATGMESPMQDATLISGGRAPAVTRPKAA